MSIGDRIKVAREQKGLTQEELGKLCGTTKQTIFKYESGIVTNIPLDRLERIAHAVSVSPAYLMGWDIDMDTLPSNIQPMPSFRKVPRIGRIACGEPITAEQNIEDYDPVPDYIKADFTLVCKGDSMINARIFDGDIVCISQSSEVHSGDIAAVLVDGDEATLKRVRIFEDHIILEPENPMYKPFSFWNEDMNKVRIIGKATHFISAVR